MVVSLQEYVDEIDLKVIEAWEKQLPQIRNVCEAAIESSEMKAQRPWIKKPCATMMYEWVTSTMGIFKGLIGEPGRYGFVNSDEATDYFCWVTLNVGPIEMRKFMTADQLVKEYSPKSFRQYLNDPTVRLKPRFKLF